MSNNNTITLNGNTYVRFPKQDSFYPESELTLAFDLYQEDWTNPQSSQIIGNYNAQGYGVRFENGLREIDELHVFDCGNSHLFRLNRNGDLVFQRALPAGNITATYTDNEDRKFYFDEQNQIVYSINRNSVITDEFPTPTGTVASIIKTDSQNQIHLLDETTQQIYRFDSNGNITNIPLTHPTHNNFVIDSDNNITSFFSNDCTSMHLDCDGNYYNAFGVNLYRNGLPWFFVGSQFNAFGIDAEDNIWIIYEGNRILKLNSNGRILMDKLFHEIVPCVGKTDSCNTTKTQKRGITFSREETTNGLEDFIWVTLEDSNYLLKLNTNADIVDCSVIGNFLDVSRFDKDFEASRVCITDHTGFYHEKIFGANCGDEGISKIVAQIAVLGFCDNDLSTVDGQVSLIRLEQKVSLLESGWHSIRFRYSSVDGLAILYIDGQEAQRQFLKGNIYYEPNNRLPTLIGADSGNFASRQQEIGIAFPKYFEGQIRNLNIYDKVVDSVPTVFNTNKTLTMTFQSDQVQSYKETVENFNLFRNSGFKSARMDLKICNSGLDEVQEKVIDGITEKVRELTPVQTVVDEIEFKTDRKVGDLL